MHHNIQKIYSNINSNNNFMPFCIFVSRLFLPNFTYIIPNIGITKYSMYSEVQVKGVDQSYCRTSQYCLSDITVEYCYLFSPKYGFSGSFYDFQNCHLQKISSLTGGSIERSDCLLLVKQRLARTL